MPAAVKLKQPILSQGGSPLTTSNTVEFSYKSLAEAFPDVDPGMEPLGTTCLFQIRHAKSRSAGGVILVSETRSTEYYNTQVGKVIQVGPLCFKTAVDGSDEMVPWKSGEWFKAGDFVRLPRYGGDRFVVPYTYEDFELDDRGNREKATVKDEIIFVLFKSKDVLAKITGDPLKIRAFID